MKEECSEWRRRHVMRRRRNVMKWVLYHVKGRRNVMKEECYELRRRHVMRRRRNVMK